MKKPFNRLAVEFAARSGSQWGEEDCYIEYNYVGHVAYDPGSVNFPNYPWRAYREFGMWGRAPEGPIRVGGYKGRYKDNGEARVALLRGIRSLYDKGFWLPKDVTQRPKINGKPHVWFKEGNAISCGKCHVLRTVENVREACPVAVLTPVIPVAVNEDDGDGTPI